MRLHEDFTFATHLKAPVIRKMDGTLCIAVEFNFSNKPNELSVNDTQNNKDLTWTI